MPDSVYDVYCDPTTFKGKNEANFPRGQFILNIRKYFTPIKIINNGPATIVFWNDKTKTIVKLSEKDKDNKYNAFCAALAKKIFGSNSKVNAIVSGCKEE
jgi:hypothetical protein